MTVLLTFSRAGRDLVSRVRLRDENDELSIFVKGERADFVLKANKRIASYWMNVHTAKECGTNTINGAALLNYKGGSEIPAVTADAIDQQNIDETETSRLAATTNPVEKCGRENLCVTDIQNVRKMPRVLAKPQMDVTMYLPINYKLQETELIGE